MIAVTSGKGGVGKSTCTVNLAVAIAQTGAKVGLLDCDVYGPDIPTMMGLKDKPEGTADKKFIPLERYGVKSMSIGYLVEEDAPVVWRGPMLHKVIEQFLKDVEWGELDYLLVDMPPGTGDAQLSLSQLVPLTGAVIVTTPQDVALVDVKKAIAMFAQVRVSVLGVVENMTGFTCSHCGHMTQIFGDGGADKLAVKYNIPVLGRVPLDPRVRVGGDTRAPIVAADPTSPISGGVPRDRRESLPNREHQERERRGGRAAAGPRVAGRSAWRSSGLPAPSGHDLARELCQDSEGVARPAHALGRPDADPTIPAMAGQFSGRILAMNALTPFLPLLASIGRRRGAARPRPPQSHGLPAAEFAAWLDDAVAAAAAIRAHRPFFNELRSRTGWKGLAPKPNYSTSSSCTSRRSHPTYPRAG